MSLYKFKVSDKHGVVSEMLVEADNQQQAGQRLQQRGVLPLECLGQGALTVNERGKFSFGSSFDVIEFTDRLVPMLQAAIPLERALGILAEGMDNEYAMQIVLDLRRGLHEGRKFSELLRDRDRIFPNIYASIVEAGEEAGALPVVMEQLREFLVEGRETKSFIISSSVYPAFILSASIIVMIVILGVIVPKFANVITSSNIKASASTRLLLQMSGIMHDYWWIFPVGVIGVIILGFMAKRSVVLKQTMDQFFLSVPLVRKLVLYSNLSRMTRTMAILMESGVHLLDTVTIAVRVLGNKVIADSFSGLTRELRQGQKLSVALSDSIYIPKYVSRMVAVGEETGKVESMLNNVADRYEKDFKTIVKRMLNLLEPVVIVSLGLIVAFIVISMFLAIMDMQGDF